MPLISLPEILVTLEALKNWIPKLQFKVLQSLVKPSCEEHQFYRERLTDLLKTIQSLPKIYDTQHNPNAPALLHYFGQSDYWITEAATIKDDPALLGQIEAYGLADLGLGFGASMGYLSIPDIVNTPGIEIDLHFNPIPYKDILAKR